MHESAMPLSFVGHKLEAVLLFSLLQCMIGRQTGSERQDVWTRARVQKGTRLAFEAEALVRIQPGRSCQFVEARSVHVQMSEPTYLVQESIFPPLP